MDRRAICVPGDFATIQEAIDAVHARDKECDLTEIVVADGHVEDRRWRKPIVLDHSGVQLDGGTIRHNGPFPAVYIFAHRYSGGNCISGLKLLCED